MAQVQVSIGGRVYRLNCNVGEEERMETLGRFLDGRIAELRGAFRDIADERIVVMAALGVADELFEARETAERRQSEAADAAARESEARAAAEARAVLLEAAVEEAAQRVETLIEALEDTAAAPA